MERSQAQAKPGNAVRIVGMGTGTRFVFGILLLAGCAGRRTGFVIFVGIAQGVADVGDPGTKETLGAIQVGVRPRTLFEFLLFSGWPAGGRVYIRRGAIVSIFDRLTVLVV